MAASLHKAQFALNLCEIHDNKELVGYCNTCQEKICSSCIKEEHTSHDWETITDILREKKRSLPVECKEIRSEQLPDLRKELSSFDRKIEEEDARFEQTETFLNGSRQEYINEINRLFDLRIDECRNESKDAINFYKEKRDALKQKVEYLEMMTTALDKDIKTLPDHDILDMEKEMKEELKKALTYSADKYMCTVLYVPGQMDVQALADMVGEIHSMYVEEEIDIDRYSVATFSMKAVSDTNAWVIFDQDDYAKLIDTAGDILKTMKVPCCDLIISDSGELVLTSRLQCCIIVLTEDEDTIRTIDTKPLCPTYISKTENDDILVTMTDDGDLYNLTPTSNRILERMTLTGQVLHTYEFMEDCKTRLFTRPLTARENKNTDICVINSIRDDSGELVVLYKDGRVKFTYRGDELNSDEFAPVDIECDDKCHILFTEQYSVGVHMLSAEGLYLCTLCQYDHLHPWTISIHDDYLWCGFYEGKLKLLKYKN